MFHKAEKIVESQVQALPTEHRSELLMNDVSVIQAVLEVLPVLNVQAVQEF